MLLTYKNFIVPDELQSTELISLEIIVFIRFQSDDFILKLFTNFNEISLISNS